MTEIKKSVNGHGFFAFFKKRGKIGLLAAAGVLGLCLLLLGGLFGGSGGKTAATEPINTPARLESYQKDVEKELETLCEAVAGVSDAQVLVSFASGYRTVYAETAAGAPATVGSGSSAAALESTLAPPAVAGVGIVCRGGNDPSIQKKLIDLVSTALGIPSNRVSVTGR